jgi:protein gp37
MSTAIEWTDQTWNPVTGCSKVSQGCKFCYAKTWHDRWHKAYHEGKKAPKQYEAPFEQVQLQPQRIKDPYKWRKPQKVFVNSMSDLFHEDVPFDFIDKVWVAMANTPAHTYQILTKRPERMLEYVTGLYENPERLEQPAKELLDIKADAFIAPERILQHWLEQLYTPTPNVWLGVSVEGQAVADRVDILRKVPAAVRFLSCEPLLGELTLELDGIHWVIVGGESGAKARPMHPDWARSLRNQCQAQGVAFFFKQWGGRTPKAGGRELDGRTWDEFPEVEA